MRHLKFIFIIILLSLLYLAGLPFLFAKLAPNICANISHNTSYDVRLVKPRLVLNIIPTAVIKCDSIVVSKKDGNGILKSDNLALKLRILPLLSGRIHINKLTSDNLVLTSKLNNNKEIEKDFLKKICSSRIRLDSLSINKFDIALNQVNNENIAQYECKNLFFKKNSRYIKLNLNSKMNIKNQFSNVDMNVYLPQNNDVTKSDINIKVSNLDLTLISSYFKNYLPDYLGRMTGLVDIDASNHNLKLILKKCSIINKDSAKSMVFPSELSILSEHSVTKKLINLKNVSISAPDISVNVNGSIYDYIGKSIPKLNLKVRIDKSKTENIIKLLPPFKTEDIDLYKLKYYGFNGDVIGNFSVSGDIKEPSLKGDVFINNGILIKPIPGAGGAIIKLNFAGKYLNFDVFVPAGGNEKVWVNGGVELYNVKYSDMKIQSSKNVDLETAQSKVVPLHEILNFVIGPVPIMDIKGKGNIDITVKGNRKTPHIWGDFNIQNADAYFKEMPDLILDKANAVLHFDDENAVFTLEKGFINNRPVNINGNCNLAGKFDFDVKSEKQNLMKLYNSVMTSTLVDDVKKTIPKFDAISGCADLKLKVYGSIKNIEDIKFNRNFFIKGSIDLSDNNFIIQGLRLINTKGTIYTDGINSKGSVESFIGRSPLSAVFTLQDNIVNLNLKIPKLKLKDTLSDKSDITGIFLDINADYKGKYDVIDYDKIILSAKILGVEPENKLQITNGYVLLKNNVIKLKNLKGFFKDSDSTFDVDLDIQNINKTPNVYGRLNVKNFDLQLVNCFADYPFLTKEARENLNKIQFKKGKINLNTNIRHNDINTSANLGGISFVYTPLDMPVTIVNGSIYSKNNYLVLNKINMLVDDMPILADGKINDFLGRKDFDLYINTKPKQEFIDKYINVNKIYPLKIKGDIIYSMFLDGVKDNFNLRSEINIGKDSSVYYLGASVGDIENAIKLNLNTDVLNQKKLRIKDFSYNKLISSQSGRQTDLNMLKVVGGIDILKDDLIFHDLVVKTNNPTDARIFNVFFRKPNIKQGQFTSNLKFNNKLSNPKLTGSFHIFETNIPFLETTVKNIKCNFKDKTIDISSNGEILGNDFTFKGILKNKLSVPYCVENAQINTKLLDLDYIIEAYKMSELEEVKKFESLEKFNLNNLVIKNLNISADEIKLRKLNAESVDALLSLSEKKTLDISNFKFKMANGNIDGKFKYNLSSNDAQISLNAKSIDANSLSYALFGLENQIYGDLTGDILLSCNGSDFNKCMTTLNGKTSFNVSDGRMPKLGSLEYLLRAGNLVKGGVTGLSINSIIDVISPLKTGDFSEIFGTINIKDGVADDIEIASRGKNLSLFITGQYNFGNSTADMEVLGLLSKKIATLFGPIGNMSINTLFNVIPGVDLSKENDIISKINKIPGIEFSNKDFRKFIAIIKGNINKENYVTSFEWIN